ncbi:MAG: Ig-like domain-containing protein [Synergistaceae bacterium]|nr:Ig-like domain-containing protein [Synergistaceae bacterium]
MKKNFLLVLFVLLFCGSAFAASESDIELFLTEYDDGSSILESDLTSLEPYRGIRLLFKCLDAGTSVDDVRITSEPTLDGFFVSQLVATSGGKGISASFELRSEQEATLTVAADYGSETVTRSFTIKAEKGERVNVPATGIDLLDPIKDTPQKSIEVTLEKGDSVTVYYQITPENATNKSIKVESVISNIAKVSDTDEYSTTITAQAKGTTEVNFTTEDGGFTATCKVTVTETESPQTGGSGGSGGCDAGAFGIIALATACFAGIRHRRR